MRCSYVLNSHLLPNSWIFLEEQIYINIDITSFDTPGHPTNNLSKEELGVADKPDIIILEKYIMYYLSHIVKKPVFGGVWPV